MKKNLLLLLAGVVIAGTMSLSLPLLHAQPTNNGSPGTPSVENQPNFMAVALHDLMQARMDLQKTEGAYGGHKEKALIALKEATAEVEASLKYSRGKQ